MQFTTSITVGGQSVVLTVPRQSKAWRKANAIFCPLGPACSKAWLLLTKAKLDALDKNGTHSIVWTEIQQQTSNAYTFPGWRLVSAERLLHGGEGDTKALYLAEFADARWVAERTADSGILIKNIRSYANPATYLTGTSGATWESLGQDLWNACGVLGTWPGLPAGLPIDAQPENTWLIGLNAWRALCAYLEQLDCAVKHDPLAAANPYSIVQLGATQTVTGSAARLKWNGETIRSAVDSAANLRVYFVFHRKSYGQERDTELVNNWAYNGEGDVKVVATGITGASGTKPLWDDLPWTLDEDGNHTNNGAVTTRADNRKSRYVTRRSVTPVHKIYSGILNTILPGGQVRAVLWRNWGDGVNADGSANPFGGTCTEYVAGPDLISGLAVSNSAAYGEAWFDRELGAPERENYLPPDLGRRTYPNYPRLPNIVQVNVDGASAGAEVSANGDGFFKGRVRRWVNSAMATLDDCWIRFVDDHDVNDGNVTGVTQGDMFLGRLSGMDTSSPDSLPVYLARKGGGTSTQNVIMFELTANKGTTLDANAVRLAHNPVNGLLEPAENIIVGDAWFSSQFTPWLLPNSDAFSAPLGSRGSAIYAYTNSQGVRVFYILWMNRYAQYLYVEADGDYNDQNNSVVCKVLAYWNQGYSPTVVANPNATIEVFDPNQFFHWPESGGLNGLNSRGIAVYRGDDPINAVDVDPPRYEFIWLEQRSIFYSATLDADMLGDDATIDIQSVRPMSWSLYFLQEDPFPATIPNPRNLYALKDDKVVTIWNSDENVAVVGGQYEIFTCTARPTWGYAKLNGTMPVGGSVTATVWKRVAGVMTKTAPVETILVHDVMLDSELTAHTRITWDYDPVEKYYVLRTHTCSADDDADTWGGQ